MNLLGGWENFEMIPIEHYQKCESKMEASLRERFHFDRLSANLNNNVPCSSNKESYIRYNHTEKAKKRTNTFYTNHPNYGKDRYIAEKAKKTEKVWLKNKNVSITIDEYKTSKKYGQLATTFSNENSLLLRNYIKKHKIPYGNYLFGKTRLLSDFVSKMNTAMGLTKKQTDGSINNFRHMVASEFKYKNAEERVRLAKTMGHAPLTSLQYVRNLYQEEN
jgi:hypothetical protein